MCGYSKSRRGILNIKTHTNISAREIAELLAFSHAFISVEEAAEEHTTFVYMLYMINGARGGVVVKAVRYKLAGRVFDSRCCHWNFSVV